MATRFSRTTRSLHQDTSAFAWVAWISAAVLLAGWLAWFVQGSVNVYAVSGNARLEVQQSSHAVSPAVSGKLAVMAAALGQVVRAGDVLFTLDATRETLRRDEERTRLAAYEPRIASAQRELAVMSHAFADDKNSSDAALIAARAKVREAQAALDFARENERRLKEESRLGGAAPIDALRAATEAQKSGAALEALIADAARFENDARSRHNQRSAQMEILERSIASLQAERTTVESTVARLSQEIDQLLVRSPVDGVVGELKSVAAGSFVNAGERLASVVPQSRLIVVAEFAPADVLGRVRPGQPGNLRLDGFPWTEFGGIDLRVMKVATEIRDQKVHVEMEPLPSAQSRIPLQHGLPGTVHVTLEQTSPLMLLLRSLGQISAFGTPAAVQSAASKP